MTSTDHAHWQRWTLLHAESVVGKFVIGNAIPDYFVAHKEIGSPVGAESDWDGATGGRIQAFTCAVLTWTPADGVKELGG